MQLAFWEKTMRRSLVWTLSASVAEATMSIYTSGTSMVRSSRSSRCSGQPSMGLMRNSGPSIKLWLWRKRFLGCIIRWVFMRYWLAWVSGLQDVIYMVRGKVEESVLFCFWCISTQLCCLTRMLILGLLAVVLLSATCPCEQTSQLLWAPCTV